jgi:hypothetical protein
MSIGVQRSVILGLLTLTFALPLIASALDARAGEELRVASSETITSNSYIAGGNVSSAGIFTKDLALVGGNVFISGPVGADLLVAGGNVTITGDVGDDLRAVGGTIIAQGAIKNDFVVGGGNITLQGKGVGGDAMIGGGTVLIGAPIGGTLRIAGGNVTIDAPVKGNVEVEARMLTLGSHAQITGNLTYKAEKQAAIENGAVVLGVTTFTQASSTKAVSAGWIATFFTLWTLLRFLMLLVGTFVFFLLAPALSRTLAEASVTRTLPSIGIGFVVLIIAPVLSVLLMMTVLGLPLGFLTLFVYIPLIIAAKLLAPIATGGLLYHWFSQDGVLDWKVILIGAVVYFLLGFIPVVGWLAEVLLFLLTFGALSSILWRSAKDYR